MGSLCRDFCLLCILKIVYHVHTLFLSFVYQRFGNIPTVSPT